MDDENLNTGEEQNELGDGDHSDDGKGVLMGGGASDNNTGSDDAKSTKEDGYKSKGSDSEESEKSEGDDNSVFEVPEELKEYGDEFVTSFKAVAESIPADKRDDLAKLGEIYQKAMDAKQEQFWENQNNAWMKEIESDKEMGGDRLPVTTTKVNKILNKFDPDGELVGYLEKVNHQNCAPLFKFMARMAPHFSEDDFVGGDRGKNSSDSPRHTKMGYNEHDYR